MSSSLVYITVHVPEAGKAVDYPSSQFTRDFPAAFFLAPSEPFSNLLNLLSIRNPPI